MTSGEDEKPSFIRAGQDHFPHNTNFADLPELPSMRKEEMLERSLFTNLEQLSKISKSMAYNERLQMQLLKQKNIKMFKNELYWYNN